MSSPEQLTNRAGVVVFEGTAAPGSTQPVQANYSGGPVTIADGASGQVKWETLNSGVELLDRTDPQNPVFLAAGTYAVQVSVQTATQFTAAGTALVALSVAAANADAMFSNVGNDPGAAGPTLVTSVQAGDPIVMLVANGDGAVQRDFLLGSATIVKLA